MAEFTLLVNGQPRKLEIAGDTPLLWALRDGLGLTGTKYGCGIAQCGACTVHIDGEATRSCVTSVESVGDRRVTTIEGLSPDRSHPLQRAWVAEQVPQCGYCQSGMLMTAAQLLAEKPQPSDAEIDASLGAHVCRCGTYQRIRSAVHRAAGDKGGAR